MSLRFFRMHPRDPTLTLPVLAILNSTLFAMLKEIHGRRGLGQGALETGLVDILPLPMPHFESATCEQLTCAMLSLLNREVLTVSDEVRKSDRQELDEIVLQSYGMEVNMLEEIYQAVQELIVLRQQKAKSIAA